MTSMDTNQIARQAVRKSFENKDILQDAFHSDEFSTLDAEDWQDLIDEVLLEGGLMEEEAEEQEKEILTECQRLYKATRLQIKARIKRLENKIKDELSIKE